MRALLAERAELMALLDKKPGDPALRERLWAVNGAIQALMDERKTQK